MSTSQRIHPTVSEVAALAAQLLAQPVRALPEERLYELVSYLDADRYSTEVVQCAEQAITAIGQGLMDSRPVFSFSPPVRLERNKVKVLHLHVLSPVIVAFRYASEMVECLNRALIAAYPRVTMYTILRPSALSDGTLYDLRHQWGGHSFLLKDERDRIYGFLIAHPERLLQSAGERQTSAVYQRMIYSRRGIGDYLLWLGVLLALKGGAEIVKATMSTQNIRMRAYLPFGFSVAAQDDYWIRVRGGYEQLLVGFQDWLAVHPEWEMVLQRSVQQVQFFRRHGMRGPRGDE